MACYILNAAILPSFGSFRYSGPLTAEEAAARLPDDAVSAIGHASSAVVLSKLLSRSVMVSRVPVQLLPGDSALVFRVKGRLPEGVVLDEQSIESIGVEFGWLERLD